MAILEGNDIALGTSLIMFLQVMSGTIMVSVGQNLFEQRLSSKLAASAPGVSLQAVLSAGNEDLAAKMRKIYEPSQVNHILVSYNQSLDYVFLFAMVLSCFSIIGSISMEWKNINNILDAQGESAMELEQDLH